jgi:fructose-bisphosphate aldolase / 6-deoxy-5-ketofructose 1-phosphate synthase
MITTRDIPADVPKDKKQTFLKNLKTITHNTGRLMLFAGDQKVEHLNKDFFGKGISREDADPNHLFQIASKAKIGAFATQLGLLARYGKSYPQIPYIVKLNSKTNLVPTKQQDPYSKSWYSVDDVIQFKKTSGFNIVGIGYTIYLGSEEESQMLYEAAQHILKAHQQGLVTILWIYPRGKAVKNEKDLDIIAGACGVANCLGSDFVKVNFADCSPSRFQEAVHAAGNTRVIIAGGGSTSPKQFLKTLYTQIHEGNTSGNATGRNVHQRPLKEAVKLCNAIFAITIGNKPLEKALKELE